MAEDTDTLTWEEASAEAQPFSFEEATEAAKKIAGREGAQVLSPLQVVGEGIGTLQRGAEKAGTLIGNLPTELINIGGQLAGGKQRLIEPPFHEGKPMLPKTAYDTLEFAARQNLAPLGIFGQTGADIGEGLAKTARKTAEGMSTPGMALTLPFAAAKPVQALFAGGIVANLPDQVNQAVKVFADPNATKAQKAEAAADVGVSALFLGLIAHGMSREQAASALRDNGVEPPTEKPPVIPQGGAEESKTISAPTPETTPDEQIQEQINKALEQVQKPGTAEAVPQPKEANATQEGQQQEGVSGERAGDDAQRPSAETSTGGGVQPAAEVPAPEAAQGDVLLKRAREVAAHPLDQKFTGHSAEALKFGAAMDAARPQDMAELRRLRDQAKAEEAAIPMEEKTLEQKMTAYAKRHWLDEAIQGATGRGIGEKDVARDILGKDYAPPFPEPNLTPAIKVGEKTFTGEDHLAAYGNAKESGQPDTSGAQEGFVDASGKFLTREQAAKISQLPTAKEPGKLHSSDLAAAAMPPVEATPQKVVPKAQKQVSKVAAIEGQKNAKAVKNELLQRLQKSLEDAPKESELPKQVRDDLKTVENSRGQSAESAARRLKAVKEGKITIEIPGDGTFTVWNTKEAIGELLDRAKRLDTSAGQAVPIKKRGISPEDKIWVERQLAKGAAQAGEKNFYHVFAADKMVPVRGEPVEIPNLKGEFFAAPGLEGGWKINEKQTGLSIGTGATKKAALLDALEKTKAYPQEKFDAVIQKTLTDRAAKTSKPEPEPISVGPGAASPGDISQQSQLQQLTQAITTGMPVDSPLPKAVDFIDKVKTKAADAKEAANNALAKTKAMADALWDSYAKLKPVTDEKRAVGRWDYAMQKADHEARLFVKAIEKAVPDKLRREAMTNWIQADGDENLLRQRAEASKPNVRPGYEMALRLTPAEKTLARNISQYLDSQLEKGREAGILSAGVENYVNQVWNRDLLNRENPFVKGLRGDFASEKLQPNFRFARKRIFDSYFAGEQAGFKPRDKDVGVLMAVYDQAFRKAIAARAFLRDLHEAKASDGRPLVEISGYGRPVESEDTGRATLIDPKTKTEETSDYRKIDHPAMRGWKWAGKDAAGNPIFLKGDLVVHPEAYTRLRNRLATSWWRQNPVARAYLGAQTQAKQGLLAFAGFHQVQETIHSLGHRVNPMELDQVDFDEPVTKELVHGGLKLADYHAEQLFGEGLASGGWVHKIPFIGNKILRPYTEYLFQDYIPKLKVTMAREAFDRNLKRYAKDLASGEVTREQLAELTANQANAAFGGLNYRAMGRNPSFQDSMRAFLLAPDFLEARAQFTAQAAKPFGREQLVALGLIAATQYVASRVLNELLDGDPHWNKPFSVVYNGKEYSLRTLPGDIHHLMTDPRSFWYHRFSSGARAGVELATGRDDRGVKRNLVEQGKDALTNLVPLSLHKRDDVKLWEAFANSMGLQERRFSASQEIGTAARKFRDANRKQSPYEEIYDAEKDAYRPLRLALQSGDRAAAQKAYDALKKTDAPGAITKNIVRYFNKPFTGSGPLEGKFIAQLDAHDRERYRQAKAEQQASLKTFWQVKR